MKIPDSRGIDPADLFLVRMVLKAFWHDRERMIAKAKRLDGETFYFWDRKIWKDEHAVPDHRIYGFRLSRSTPEADFHQMMEYLNQEVERIEHVLVESYVERMAKEQESNVTPASDGIKRKTVRKRIPLPYWLFYIPPIFTIIFGGFLLRSMEGEHLGTLALTSILGGIVWFFAMRGLKKFRQIYQLE